MDTIRLRQISHLLYPANQVLICGRWRFNGRFNCNCLHRKSIFLAYKSSLPHSLCQPSSGPAKCVTISARSFSPMKPRAKTHFLALSATLSVTLAFAQGDPSRAFDPATAAVRTPGTTVRIDLIGDSTQTDNAGYGRGFCANLTTKVDCINMAKGGASTKTFREQGLWERSLETKPDYMLIQFGHNDLESKDHLPRQTTMAEYEANLRRYVDEARAAGIKPLFVTPLTRRYFEADGKIHSDLTAHSETMKRVAAEMNVPLIDLQHDSIAYLAYIGEKQGNTLAITKKDDDGKTIFDKTHLNWKGSYAFGRVVTADMGKAAPELAKYVKPDA